MNDQNNNNYPDDLIENAHEPLYRRRILLTVTGGIAAYKTCYLIREIVRREAEVRVVMTSAAQEFVSKLTFATLSGQAVSSKLFPPYSPVSPIHLDVAGWGDIMVIAPATANFIGKLANGIADDCASTIAMAFRGSILIAPAMNPAMWSNPAVGANVEILKKRGYFFVGPEVGEMGGIDEKPGLGRMSEPEAILGKIEELLSPKNTWKNRRVLVTSGPTREALDPVRYFSNRSSGVMGDTVARKACLSGAEATLIRGGGAMGNPPQGMEVIVVETASEMAEAVKSRFHEIDVLIMAAAVADWTVSDAAENKLKKKDGLPQISWKQTEDILAWAGKNKGRQIVVGFALETENHIEAATQKLIAKNIDLIALNDPTVSHSRFGGATTQLTLLQPGRDIIKLPVSSKFKAAEEILNRVATLFDNL